VVIGCSRTAPDWQLGDYEHVLADVTDEAAVADLFSVIKKKYARLDHLINNAGVAAMNHSLLMPIDVVRRIFATNVIGPFQLCAQAARLMQKRKYGRIVNFSTVAVGLKLEGEAAYAASKAAVLSLTEILAREYAPWGITVNAVSPTPIDTDLIRAVPADKIEALVQRQAVKRLGTFEDVANVVDFYLRRESSFITGQNLYLGGV
jgi:3-oxoacyl-[acyl-carrier protein] reductase